MNYQPTLDLPRLQQQVPSQSKSPRLDLYSKIVFHFRNASDALSLGSMQQQAEGSPRVSPILHWWHWHHHHLQLQWWQRCSSWQPGLQCLCQVDRKDRVTLVSLHVGELGLTEYFLGLRELTALSATGAQPSRCQFPMQPMASMVWTLSVGLLGLTLSWPRVEGETLSHLDHKLTLSCQIWLHLHCWWSVWLTC